MTTIAEIIERLNSFAPPVYQESYDNAQLLTGDPKTKVTKTLICLDCTEEVIDEAIEKQCELVVCHHPIIFSGLKSLTGKNYIERTVIKAIKNDIAIFGIHTNLDNVIEGVNKKFADLIGLDDIQILSPKQSTLQKLTVYVPVDSQDELRQAINDAGAGNIGNYSNCSFSSEGTGRFQANEAANPTIGEKGKLEEAKEVRIEFLVPVANTGKVLAAMRHAHPYEEVAYFLEDIKNTNQEVGSGMFGMLTTEMTQEEFLLHLQKTFNRDSIKFTPINKKIKKVALCGGAGSFLLKRAISVGADAFVSSDFKYHEFFDAENKILIADIGHYESEVATKELIYEILNKNFTNIAFHLSEINTNPVQYFTKHG